MSGRWRTTAIGYDDLRLIPKRADGGWNDNSRRLNKMGFMGLLGELWAFMRERKKLWLLPILVVMLLVGGLLVFAQGSALAPFIYTIF